MDLQDITQPIEQELKHFNDHFRSALRSKIAFVDLIARYIVKRKGKKIRPALVFLTAKACGEVNETTYRGASLVEILHTATLIHDDIIDGAETRRGKASAYKKFGLKNTLVAGDFLFIKAFEFAGKFDDTVVQWTADACALLTEGETLQGFFNRNRSVTLDDYVEIVKRKTASLFQTGAKVGAYLAGAQPAIVEETDRYGLNMGIAFQMIDDILDIVGHIELLGKPTGMDIRDGNPSLPIILALNEGQSAVGEAFQCGKPTEAQVAAALEAIKTGSAIQRSKTISNRYAEEALKSIKKLPPSIYRNGLKTLVQLIIDRNF